jgi:putative inorganic carbon (hco3(-)) transporter
MSFTALAWVVVYGLLACASFVNPIFGMLGYFHEYYNRPELKWWGKDLPSWRWNLIIAVVLGVTFLLRRSSLREMRLLKNPALPWLLLLQVVMLVVSTFFAVRPDLSWHWTIQWSKTALIFPFLLIGVIRSRNAFNLFAAAHMLGGFWWGWDSWLDPKRSEGRLQNVGSGDTQDDNAAACHLVTILPLTLVYLFTEKDKRLRAIALAATPFIINTIILCNSRGATLGMVGALLATMVLVRRGYRMRLGVVGVGVAAIFLFLADPQFIARQQTTIDPQDGSSQERLDAWVAGARIVKDFPQGTGGRGFHALSPSYLPALVEAHNGEERGPHNTYVMVAAEWGVLGFVAYLGYIASTFLMLYRIRKAANGQDFYYWRALGLQVSFIAYLIASMFAARLYAEIGYWMVSATFALYRLQATEQAEAEVKKAPAPEAQPDDKAVGLRSRLLSPA